MATKQVNMNKKTGPILLILVSSFLFSCNGPSVDEEEKVATVNSSPILLKDFRKEVTLASRRDPGLKLTPEMMEEVLDSMIDKRLLIDAAVKKGISEDERFLESIKAFWEQTLIRELIQSKNREWADKLFVTDEEVRGHYERMRYKLTIMSVKTSDDPAAEAALKKIKTGGMPEAAEAIGPLFVENISVSDPLYSVFTLVAGDAGVLKTTGGYMAFKVIKKEAVPVPPIETVYSKIEAMLLEEKKERALEDWIEELEEAARITIDAEALGKASDEK